MIQEDVIVDPNLIETGEDSGLSIGVDPPGATPAERRKLGWNATSRLAASRVEAFAAMAKHLSSLGLSAPEIYGVDLAAGYAVIEDLGDALYARIIGEGGADEIALYQAAAAVLAHVHQAPIPTKLEAPGGVSWPLLDYDALAPEVNADLFVEWLPRAADVRIDDAARARWEQVRDGLIVKALGFPRALTIRDYHAENLLWLPEREGARRVGLLDFQDAVRGWRAWEFAMLLHRRVPRHGALRAKPPLPARAAGSPGSLAVGRPRRGQRPERPLHPRGREGVAPRRADRRAPRGRERLSRRSRPPRPRRRQRCAGRRGELGRPSASLDRGHVQRLALQEGSNALEIVNVGDTAAAQSFVHLDRFEIPHPRGLAARAGRFEGRCDASGAANVSGLRAAHLLDTSQDPPVWLFGGRSTFDITVTDKVTERAGLANKTQDYVKRRTEIDYATYVRFRGKLAMK